MGTMKTFRVRHTKPFFPSQSPSVPKVSCTKKQGYLCATIMLLVAAPTVGQVHLLGKGWSPLFQSGFPGRDHWQSAEWNCLSSSTSVRRQRRNMLLPPFLQRTVCPSWRRKVEHKPQVNSNNWGHWKSEYGQHLQSTGLLYEWYLECEFNWIIGLDIQKHLEGKKHKDQQLVAFSKAYYIHSFPAILCPASLDIQIPVKTWNPSTVSFQAIERKALKALPTWKAIQPQKAKTTLLAAWLDHIDLSFVSPHLSTNSRFLSALHWQLFIALHASQTALLHNLICPANISVYKCPFDSFSVHIALLSAVLSSGAAPLGTIHKVPHATLSWRSTLVVLLSRKQNICPNLELQLLLGKGCTFHPCWKELGPLWLIVKRKKSRNEPVDLGSPRWGCAISLQWGTAEISKLLDWVLQGFSHHSLQSHR